MTVVHQKEYIIFHVFLKSRLFMFQHQGLGELGSWLNIDRTQSTPYSVQNLHFRNAKVWGSTPHFGTN